MQAFIKQTIRELEMKKTYFSALLAISLAAGTSATLAEDYSKDDIEGIVHDYIVNKNPEVLIEASQVLQQKQQVAAEKKAQTIIAQNATAVFNAANSPIVGNKNAPVAVVEFFDYQCGHCRNMLPIMKKVMAANTNVRYVFKELPIFDENSKNAAKAALAANMQGKYLAFHNALLQKKGRLSTSIINDTAKSVGIDVAKMQKDMKSKIIEAELAANQTLARTIGIVGTPAFIIGDRKGKNVVFIPGATNQTTLQDAIKKVN